MPIPVITSHPTARQRRARTIGRYASAVLVTVLHLLVAAVVLAVRVPYTLLGIAARTVATAELALAARTGRTPLGQTAGVTLAHAFLTEFAAGYRTATTTTR